MDPIPSSQIPQEQKSPKNSFLKYVGFAAIAFVLFSAVFYVGFVFGKKSSIQTVPFQKEPSSLSTTIPPTAIPTEPQKPTDVGIPITSRTVSFARVNNKVYLRYKGKIHSDDLSLDQSPTEVNLPNSNSYTWYGLVNGPEKTGGWDEVFSFKTLPNQFNFIFATRWDIPKGKDQFEMQLTTYYYDAFKPSEKLSTIFSGQPHATTYNFPKIGSVSKDSKYLSFDMYGCWNCGGHYPETMIVNLQTGITKRVGKTIEFTWKEDGKFEYKDYVPTPCPTPTGVVPGEYPLESECPKDPTTLPIKTGQI